MATGTGPESPEPRAQSGYSGRLLLRMPRTLHAELADAAERDGTSLNQFIVGTLARAMGAPGADAAASDNGTSAAPDRHSAGTPVPRREPRLLGIALVVNLAAIVVAGSIAVVLLIAAWHRGF